LNGGSGYTNGTYFNVPITGGSPTTVAYAGTVVVSGGAVTSVTINYVSGGNGYKIGDVLSFTNSNVGGTGSGASFTVATLGGQVQTVTITNPGSGYSVNDVLSASNSSLGGGSGFAFAIQVSAVGGTVTAVTLSSGGFGYLVGDQLSILNTDLDGPTGAGFIAQPSGFVNTTAITTVTDAAFPYGATTATSNDGYALCELGSNVSVSVNQDFGKWNALQVFTVESRADTVNAVDQIAGGNIAAFGHYSTEFWQDAGTYPLPYARVNGEQQDWGLAAKWSRATVNNSLCFLGQNYQGQVQVCMMSGYTIVPVSPPDFSNIVNTFPVVNDAIGASGIVDGHEFYIITFPSGNRSFYFDSYTGLWGEIQSGPNDFERFLGTLAFTFNYSTYWTDPNSGTAYFWDPTNLTHNGNLINYEVDTMEYNETGNQFGVDALYLDMETGNSNPNSTNKAISDPQVLVSCSKNGGRTDDRGRQISLGTEGTYTRAQPLRRWGSARRFRWKIKASLATPFILTYIAIKIRQGREVLEDRKNA